MMKLFRLFYFISCTVGGLTMGNDPAGSNRLVDSASQIAQKSNFETKSIELKKSQSIDSIKIGLLIRKQGDKTDYWQAAVNGAELAVSAANAKEEFDGSTFCLVIRSITGLWGSGSKEIVKLIYEDSVNAIVSSLDGRSAHLVEQIATKAQVVLVATRATDPTLSQINIPWFFRCIPDDRLQALALVNEIFRNRKLWRVASVAGEEYDYRMAAKSFTQVAETEGYPSPLQLTFETSDDNLNDVLNQIELERVEGIVIFLQPLSAADLVQHLRERGMKQQIFGTISSVADNELFDLARAALEDAIFIAPGYRYTSVGKDFQRNFQNIYGYPPSTEAAYAFDGTSLIIEAIKNGGLNRETIRDTLANIDYSNGVTGPIRFDTNGNRAGPVNLLQIIKGRPNKLTR